MLSEITFQFVNEADYIVRAIAPLAAALIAAAPSIIGGIGAKIAHNKYAENIGGLKLDEPKGLSEAENILGNLSTVGMPGYGRAKETIMGTMPETINAMKEAAGNPSVLIGGINDAQSRVTGQLADLGVKDAMVKLENARVFADFLSGPKATFDLEKQKFANDIKLAQEREKLAGWTELVQGVNQGVGAGISGYGTFDMLNTYKSMPSDWRNFMGGNTKAGTDSLVPSFSWDKTTLNKSLESKNPWWMWK